MCISVLKFLIYIYCLKWCATASWEIYYVSLIFTKVALMRRIYICTCFMMKWECIFSAEILWIVCCSLFFSGELIKVRKCCRNDCLPTKSPSLMHKKTISSLPAWPLQKYIKYTSYKSDCFLKYLNLIFICFSIIYNNYNYVLPHGFIETKV